jgi:hypothetical protein
LDNEHRHIENAELRATIQFIDKRMTSMEERNTADHDEIKEKIEAHNGWAGKISELNEYCTEMKKANLRSRVVRLETYLGVGIALVVFGFGIIGWIIQHYLSIIARKIIGG